MKKERAKKAGQQVEHAMTDQYGLSQYGDVQLVGAFGNQEGELNVNDEITGGGRVIYKGSSTDNISISNLTENTIYHFRAWSVDDNNNYSSTNLNTSILTWAKVPYYPPFDKMPKFDMPFGWEREGTAFRLSQSSDKSTFQLECNNTAGDAINGKLNSITTPWILLGEGTNRVVFDANFTTWKRPTSILPYYA